jgi:hypothetical protein
VERRKDKTVSPRGKPEGRDGSHYGRREEEEGRGRGGGGAARKTEEPGGWDVSEEEINFEPAKPKEVKDDR